MIEEYLGNVIRQRETFIFRSRPQLINGHPVYAMPTRIGACSYRTDIRYSFSLSYQLWAVTISEQSSKRLCARGVVGVETI